MSRSAILMLAAAITGPAVSVDMTHAQPVVRDHRGERPRMPPPNSSGWQPTPTFCFQGILGVPVCTPSTAVRDHRKRDGAK